MAQTYLNDNKSMPYPFFGYGSLPFSMACIVGLSVCIRGEEPSNGYGPLIATSIAIAEDAINMAIGRKTPTNTLEFIGTLYATTAGYSIYLPATAYTTYEDGSSGIRTMEDLLKRDAEDTQEIHGRNGTIYRRPASSEPPEAGIYYRLPDATVTTTNGANVSQVNVDAATTSMLVFYREVSQSGAIVTSTAASTGYMIIGTIPKESIGVYKGEFALDPACVTYITEAVFGRYSTLCINGFKYPLEATLKLEAGGLVDFEVSGSTVTMMETTDSQKVVLSETQNNTDPCVTSISGVPFQATIDDPEPTLTFEDMGSIIRWEWAHWSPSGPDGNTLTLEIDGTTSFPSCYGGLS